MKIYGEKRKRNKGENVIKNGVKLHLLALTFFVPLHLCTQGKNIKVRDDQNAQYIPLY